MRPSLAPHRTQFEIFHEIEYRYSKPVFLEPHTFFLRPREDASQRLVDFELLIEPEPVTKSVIIDPFGNNPMRAWFEETWDFMVVRSKSTVEIFRSNPFDYLLDNTCMLLPVQYTPATQRYLKSYARLDLVPEAVASFAEKISSRTARNTSLFLTELCREISSSFQKTVRPEGDPWPAAMTLHKKEGACRDLTVLFMECCRAKGLVSRFTSGYFEGDPEHPEKELHAWCEVYLEGGGWRGFDPMAGIAVADQHVPIASAPYSDLVSPVSGTFRKDQQTYSSMSAKVSIKRKN